MHITLRCIAKRLMGGTGCEFITCIWWEKVVGKKVVGHAGCYSQEMMVAYIEDNGENSVWCPDNSLTSRGAWLHVKTTGEFKYVQSMIDGRTTDSLISLLDR
jgi:hypothetical protein